MISAGWLRLVDNDSKGHWWLTSEGKARIKTPA
jgi:hypothetical protein